MTDTQTDTQTERRQRSYYLPHAMQ